MTDWSDRTVTKRELIQRIADDLDQKKVIVRDVLQRFLDEIASELARGSRIEFREFGVFDVRERGHRRGQNPQTLTPVPVPPRRVVRFKPGSALRDLVGASSAQPVEQRPAPAPQPQAPAKPEAKVTPRPAPPQPPPTTPGSPF